MDIEFGNAGTLETDQTGWFIGFSQWAKSREAQAANLRYMPKDSLLHTLHVKWMAHSANDNRGTQKPPSQGRTISMLVSENGSFRIHFAPNDQFDEAELIEYRLSAHGDFVIWGENIHHRWFVDEACTIMTLRWIPVVG